MSEQGLVVSRIKPFGSFQCVQRAVHVARPLQRPGQQVARPALRGQKLHRFAQRPHRRCRLAVQHQDAQVQLGFRQFRIEMNRALILRSRFLPTLQRCVGVAKLEMRVSEVRLFRDKFLQRFERGLIIVAADIALRLLQQIVERIRQLLRLRSALFLRR